MERHFSAGEDPAGIPSGGFAEAIWETVIAVAIAAAVCAGVASLAAHLNEAAAVRGPPVQTVDGGVAGVGLATGGAASRLN